MTFNFEKVRENLERVALEPEGFLKHPQRKEFEQTANEVLERCSYKTGWRWKYQEEIIRERSLARLANILILADGDVEGWKIIDLGCGSPDEEVRNDDWLGRDFAGRYHKGWLPYKAEVLTSLGARVVGVDYRPNPSASYEHRVVDFGDFCDHFHYGDCFNPEFNPKKYHSSNKDKQELAKERLEGDFDLVIATSLVNDGLTNDAEGYGTLTFLLGVCAKPQQVQYFDSFRKGHMSSERRNRFIWTLKRSGIEVKYDGGDNIGISK